MTFHLSFLSSSKKWCPPNAIYKFCDGTILKKMRTISVQPSTAPKYSAVWPWLSTVLMFISRLMPCKSSTPRTSHSCTASFFYSGGTFSSEILSAGLVNFWSARAFWKPFPLLYVTSGTFPSRHSSTLILESSPSFSSVPLAIGVG